MTVQQEIKNLIKSIRDLQGQMDRWSGGIKNITTNFGSTAPVTNGLNNLTNRMSSLVDPISKLGDAFNRSDALQKKMLAINTDLTTFTKVNAANLNNLKGGFLENAEELFQNFSEGLRFNSDGLNVLQNRMKLTGQNTDKLRQVTKLLLNATNGSVDSVDRLSTANKELGRKFMVSNEKLLDALARNEEVLDFGSMFGLGEQTASEIMKLTAMMESKGISVKNQNQVVKLLTGSDQKTAEMRTLLGLGYDANEKFIEGQITAEQLLDKGLKFAEQNLIQQKGMGKMMNTNTILQGIGGEELKNTVVALTQTNKLLNSSNKNNEMFMSKEDKFYNTFETYSKEHLKYVERTVGEHYGIVEKTPAILNKLLAAQVGGMAGGLLSDLFASKLSSRLENILTAKRGLQAATATGNQAAISAARAGVAAAMGGPVTRLLSGFLRFAGPVGMIAGTVLPLLPDALGAVVDWFKGDEQKNKSRELEAAMAEVAQANRGIMGITSASEIANAARENINKNTTTQLEKIAKIQEQMAKDPEASKIFSEEANAQMAILKQIVNQAKTTNLSEQELLDLEKRARSSAEDFYQKIESNTRLGTDATKKILDRTPIPKGPDTEKKKTDINDLILKSLATALNRKSSTNKEQKEMIEKLETLHKDFGLLRSESRKTSIVGTF